VWRNEFTHAWVEDITRKSGSFKAFDVFVKMLLNGARGESSAVTVELLTYADLEMLRERMGARRPPAQAASVPAALQNKRYLILTYLSDYDRVHYPLPLAYDADPDPARLRGTISRLRAALEVARAGGAYGATGRVGEIAVEVRKLREENKTLRAQLQRLEAERGAQLEGAVGGLLRDQEAAERQLRALARERDLLRERAEGAERDAEEARHRAKRAQAAQRRAAEAGQREQDALREALREARARARALQGEVEAVRRGRGPTPAGARAGSRAGSAPRGPSPPAGAPRGPSPGPARAASAAGRAPSRGRDPVRRASPAPARASGSGLTREARDRIRNRDRPWAEGSRAPSGPRSGASTPGRSSSRQRFDPTAWVQEQREKRAESQTRAQRAFTPPSSRPHSLAPSGPGTPRRGVSPAGERARGGGPGRGGPEGASSRVRASPRAPVPSTTRAARGVSPGRLPGREGGATVTVEDRRGGAPSRGRGEGARVTDESPSRALMAVKERLATVSSHAGSEAGRAADGPGAAGAGGGAGAPEATFYQEVEDIDERLQKLQAYLKQAKAEATAS